ncbi:MAG: Dehydrogenase with different specificity [Gammaproteobacteria bacterium]|jgi:glucose 1-dehydrogenase/3-oxoacyl-[acyl-carrier protein] reductase|nr:Dehydrogenase with different specificity [Gammaproteobacteria bacterium]MCE3239438.1 Dehydrogenase with different specificity [Gammaproteobacteria bacterium]
MKTNLKGKKVIVTGGNRGIGKAIALAFAEEGCDIVITYNTGQKEAEQTVKELEKYHIHVKSIQFDANTEGAEMRLVKESSEFLGDIHILVNNAGTLSRHSFLDIPEPELLRVLKVNTIAPFRLMQTVGHYMTEKQTALKEQDKALEDRSIINITSLSRKVITAGLSHYETSKAATSQMTKSAAMDKDFRENRIRVNEVAPGLIPTDINRDQWETGSTIWKKRVGAIPLFRPGLPNEIAQAVVWLANSAWTTGTTVTVDGGRTRNWSGSEIAPPDLQSIPQARL